MKSCLSLFILLTITITFTSHAEDAGMVPQLPDQTNPAVIESDNKTFAGENADLCQNLRKEMDSLKGRPLRRNAVAQRYDMECRQRRP
jgi:hypothetical protein